MNSRSYACHFHHLTSPVRPLLNALGPLQYLCASLVVADLVANHTRCNIDVWLTRNMELLAEVLRIPCASHVTGSASTVVLASSGGSTA